MGFEPERSRGAGRINTEFTPPCRLITVTMKSPAQWHREFVTDLAAERPVLRKAQMMSVTGPSSADQASLL
jgi:hypothetical protein